MSSSNNTISKNTATGNGEYGIVLASALKSTLSGNSAYSNARGLYIGSSDDNIFSGNTVRDNSIVGFFICAKSDRNRVYNNYFNDVNETVKNGVGNSYNIAKKAGTNIIGGPYLGGNFWGKPDGKGFSQTAPDANKDGISDIAYANISASIYSDYLPLTSNSSPAPSLVSDFSATPTSGNPPLNVTFTDKTTGSPTSWKWDFGDGTSATEKNPKHSYTKAGTYTVTLTSGNGASSNTATKTNYITVTAGTTLQKPVARFWGSRTTGTAPLTIGFTDNSTNSPTSWKWNFGDGSSSTLQNPKHAYSTKGNYSVTLTATNAAGSGTLTRSNYIKLT